MSSVEHRQLEQSRMHAVCFSFSLLFHINSIFHRPVCSRHRPLLAEKKKRLRCGADAGNFPSRELNVKWWPSVSETLLRPHQDVPSPASCFLHCKTASRLRHWRGIARQARASSRRTNGITATSAGRLKLCECVSKRKSSSASDDAHPKLKSNAPRLCTKSGSRVECSPTQTDFA